MSKVGSLRYQIALMTQPDGVDALPGFDLRGFQNRFPEDGLKRWNQKCGAIDTLLDIETGLAEFFRLRDRGVRPTFFEAFGFVQGLVVQQDAAFWLGRAMGFHKSGRDYPLLDHVRNVRNRSVGHPAYADRLNDPSSAMWSPAEITEKGFSITLYFESESETRWVEFSEIYKLNDNLLSEYMTEMIAWIKQLSEKCK